MVKKLLIVLTIVMLLVVSTTPALAQKPPDSNGKGNSANDNHGKGHSVDNNGTSRNDANPNSQGSNTSTGNGVNQNTVNNPAGHGFDEWGYNDTARIFNGTGLSWCMAKGTSEAQCLIDMYPYAYSKLMMKWNAEWDRGNAEGWSDPPYDAWLSNLWMGNGGGRSGEVSHYKIVWVGTCVEGSLFPNGGYCIWGQFEVIMDMGVDDGEHYWFAHALPNGYGFYP